MRILKAIDHIEKARLLDGIDDEMGAIRLIAAEEELVVSIFEWLKLNENKMPEHRDLVRSYKNHQVKLMFYPVLSIMHFALGWIIQDGLAFKEIGHYKMKLEADIKDECITFNICGPDNKTTVPLNPLAMFICLDNQSNDEVIDSLYQELCRQIKLNHDISLKKFVTLRSDYRNQLLYSEDGGFITGGDSVSEILNNGFNATFRELLWTIAILLGHDPLSPNLGIVSQFISIYRRVLIETKAIRKTDNSI